MAALTSASFVVLFACSRIFVLCEGSQELKVTAGEDATLQCRSHGGADIEVIKWSRTDLKSDDGLVFYLSPDQINGDYQNSLFQGRVELQDPERKDGNASVILKNVNINDAGTYECLIAVKNSGHSKRAAVEPISTIKLTVTGTLELNVTAGEDATLQCQSHRGADITLIEWSRTDLKADDGLVFYLSPDRINGDYQNSLFQGRVELQDPERKDGNASVILKNVNINDTGTYECWIAVKNSGHSKRAAVEPISTIKLTVTGGDKEGGVEKRADTDGGDQEGGDQEGGGQERTVGPMIGLPVFAVLLVAVAVVGTMIFKKHRGNKAPLGEETEPTNIRLTDPGHTAGHKEGGDKEGGDK